MNVLRIGAAAAIAAVALLAAVMANAANPSTFDGTPASPLAFTQIGQTEWDVQVHSRGDDVMFNLHPINAQHGADCSGPPATHPNTSYEGSVYICRDHVMTSINGDGYAVIYLTPNQLFDFSNGGSVTFDISTDKMSSRDWWDILITPYAQNHALPLLSNLSEGVDLQGFPLNTISIASDNGQGSPVLKVVRNGVVQEFENGEQVPSIASGVTASNQAATRQTFKFTAANGRMKFERLASSTASALVFWDYATTANFTSGIVQFGHHSYDPFKDGAGVAATWHWDNMQVEPSIPFTMIKADRRYTQGGMVNFAAPAPANAYLRFSAICRVRVDGTLVTRQPSAWRYDRYKEEHTSSYWVPIAQGKTSVGITFQDDNWYSGPCIAKDFAIWSLDSAAPTATASPAPTSTPQPTATTTAVPPTPTNTPTPSPASTFTPTPTASQTPTPVPVNDRCRVSDRNDANTGWAEREGRWVEQQPGLWTCLVPREGRVP